MSASLHEQLLHVPVDSVKLEGSLVLPPDTGALVIFVHGSGSSRHSPRNRFVADVLNRSGIGTFLFDLLTRAEDTVYERRFDIELLTSRLKTVTRWMIGRPETANLRVGYFGASTGAAAAIRAAADLGVAIGAVVSRGGRPDLAERALGRLRSPTLLIVGGFDDVVVELNRQAYEGIKVEKELEIVEGATHLFEEPGALEQVARSAADWFRKHLLSG
jgi:putative phosphoribosyl transferase